MKFTKEFLYKAAFIIASAGVFSIYTFRQEAKLGLDLKGGVSIMLEASSVEGNDSVKRSSMEKLAEVIDRRVNSLGVVEPVIQIVGNNKLLVEIPGIKDSEEAISMMGKTALLEFRVKEKDGTYGEALMTGKDLIKSEVVYDMGNPIVSIKFSNEGAKQFYNITKDNVGKQLAILLDGEEQSAPFINTAISGGAATISGGFSFDTAKKLSLLLSSGALPLKVEVAEVKVISATLGEEAFNICLNAGLLAIVFIVFFMLFWYFLPGLLASIALAVFGVTTIGIMNLIGATFTLPGIAGFILSLGMAVDANVIIFEMIKEDLENGSVMSAAIKSGFKKAYSSILDSNITTLIITLILFFLGTGAIKGYAVTLSLGVLASMFSAIFVTRMLLEFVTMAFNLKDKRVFGIFNFKFNLKTVKYLWGYFSIFVLTTVIALYFIFAKGFNYGIDFTGGNMFALKFEESVNSERFTSAVNTFSKDLKAQIQFTEENGDKRTVYLRTVELSTDEKGDLYAHLRKSCGIFDVDKEESIGATVGQTLKNNAILALVLGVGLILLYISIRFEFKFALSAVIALLHDIIVSIGAIAYLGYEVNSTFIVAVLTILGYSINDTIVVFDRIRENMKKMTDFKTIVDQSINQVFMRSINTSVTVFLALLALIWYDIPSLKTLLTTFLVGIISGTYSSIFIASPLVYLLDKKKD